ncbi:MAG: hypothetical protein WCK86_17435, partial [Planctomycetia bacterium]
TFRATTERSVLRLRDGCLCEWQWAVVGGGCRVSGDGGRGSDDTGLVVLRVICNPFRVGARVGEVPVAARGLPPAIFCQPFGLKLGPSNLSSSNAAQATK